MNIIIFANGNIREHTPVTAYVKTVDLIIAADGGLRHVNALGLTPKVLIGDMDSVDKADIERITEKSVQRITYPVHKDQTDLELALFYAIRKAPDKVVVFGALGGRWDMTLSNLMVMAAPDFAAVDIRFVDGNVIVFPIRGGEIRKIQGRPGDTISLIPVSEIARGITLEGFSYPLKQGALPFGSSKGVSNQLAGRHAVIRLEEGVIICFHEQM